MPVERVDVLIDMPGTPRPPLPLVSPGWASGDFFDAIRSGALAAVQPDIAHAGGITECKKIAAIAEAGYTKVALHAPLGPLALAASIQLDACLPNFLVQEHNEVNDARQAGKTVIGRGYLKTPFVLDDDGGVAVPQTPGLGVALKV